MKTGLSPGERARVVNVCDAAALDRVVQAAAAGDERAWNELVARFESLVWSVVRAHRLNDADAADVVQTTWLRLVEHLADIQSPDRLGAWLATTARRASLRVIATSQRQTCTDREIGAELATDGDIGRRLFEDERNRALWNALERIPARPRRLLRMLAAEPAPSYDEISAAIGMPKGSIGPTRARALDRLRRELETDVPAPTIAPVERYAVVA